jgi:hypothetical protein
MKRIDENRLETDVAYRFAYLAEFMEFGSNEIAAVHAAASHLAPHVPMLVDAVYVKLFKYDATKRHFVPPQEGYAGKLAADTESLSSNDEVIKFRKEHLARYLLTLVTKPYDGKMVQYLDTVGKMHTPNFGSKAIDVPLVQMNALLGFVADALHATIMNLGLDRETEINTLRAYGKLLWLQNDLINRHYAAVPADRVLVAAG